MPDRPLEIRWLKRALANLDAEAAFIALDNPAAAARVVDTVARTVELLARNPGLGRPGRVEGTRELVVANTPYLIPYRVRNNVVEILRVFHGARSGRKNSDRLWHPECFDTPKETVPDNPSLPSRIPGFAACMISRTFATTFPRQSPNSLIFSSINGEADSTGTGRFMYTSNSRS